MELSDVPLIPQLARQPQVPQVEPVELRDDQSDTQSISEEDAFNETIMRLENAIAQDELKLIEALDERELLMTEEPNHNIDNSIDLLSATIKKITTLIDSRTESLELRQKIAKKKLLEQNGGTKNISSIKYNKQDKVPQNLPKFRQGGNLKEPIEFLETFDRIMEAHNITEDRYLSLLPLCLDAIDGQWLSAHKKRMNSEEKWETFGLSFIAHFQHPNAAVLWQDKIRQLRVDDTGVQRYTDQFVRLAGRLRWELSSETAIYQYKQGLPEWMLDSITSAEAATLANGGQSPGVEILGRMSLQIEASRRNKIIDRNEVRNTSRNQEIPRAKDTSRKKDKCSYCHNLGHTEAICCNKQYDLKKNQLSGQLSLKDNDNFKKSEAPKLFNKEDKIKYPLSCYACGKNGHRFNTCPEGLTKKAINKQKDPKVSVNFILSATNVSKRKKPTYF